MTDHGQLDQDPQIVAFSPELLKLADLENELLDETSLESFLSEFKLALGIAAELAPSYSFDDDEEQRACEALQRRRGE